MWSRGLFVVVLCAVCASSFCAPVYSPGLLVDFNTAQSSGYKGPNNLKASQISTGKPLQFGSTTSVHGWVASSPFFVLYQGYFVPAVSGTYVFKLDSNQGSQLFMHTSTLGLQLITNGCFVNGVPSFPVSCLSSPVVLTANTPYRYELEFYGLNGTTWTIALSASISGGVFQLVDAALLRQISSPDVQGIIVSVFDQSTGAGRTGTFSGQSTTCVTAIDIARTTSAGVLTQFPSGTNVLGTSTSLNFLLRFSGFFRPNETGFYSFGGFYDDGLRVLLMNPSSWITFTYRTTSGFGQYGNALQLTAGVYYPIIIDFTQYLGPWYIQARYKFWKTNPVSGSVLSTADRNTLVTSNDFFFIRGLHTAPCVSQLAPSATPTSTPSRSPSPSNYPSRAPIFVNATDMEDGLLVDFYSLVANSPSRGSPLRATMAITGDFWFNGTKTVHGLPFPFPSGNPIFFSTYAGYFVPSTSGAFLFQVTCDMAARLYMDYGLGMKTVVDCFNRNNYDVCTANFTVSLNATLMYRFEIDFYGNSKDNIIPYGWVIGLEYFLNGVGPTIVKGTELRQFLLPQMLGVTLMTSDHQASAYWRGDHWPITSTSCVSSINDVTNNGGVFSKSALFLGNFTNTMIFIRFQGFFVPLRSGWYQFYMKSDDGFRLLIYDSDVSNPNGTFSQLLQAWKPMSFSTTTYSSVVRLDAKNFYPFVLEFFQISGNTGIYVSYSYWTFEPSPANNYTDYTDRKVPDYTEFKFQGNARTGVCLDKLFAPTPTPTPAGITVCVWGDPHITGMGDLQGTRVTYTKRQDNVMLIDRDNLGFSYQAQMCTNLWPAASQCSIAIQCRKFSDVYVWGTDTGNTTLYVNYSPTNLLVGTNVTKSFSLVRRLNADSYYFNCTYDNKKSITGVVTIQYNTKGQQYLSSCINIPNALFNKTNGLIGNWDNNPTNDVAYRNGTKPTTNCTSYDSRSCPELDDIQTSWVVQKYENLFNKTTVSNSVVPQWNQTLYLLCLEYCEFLGLGDQDLIEGCAFDCTMSEGDTTLANNALNEPSLKNQTSNLGNNNNNTGVAPICPADCNGNGFRLDTTACNCTYQYAGMCCDQCSFLYNNGFGYPDCQDGVAGPLTPDAQTPDTDPGPTFAPPVPDTFTPTPLPSDTPTPLPPTATTTTTPLPPAASTSDSPAVATGGPSPPPGPSQTPYAGAPSESLQWGDPHIRTFDGMTVTYLKCGDHIVAKSTDNQLQYHARHCIRGDDGSGGSATCAVALRCSATAPVFEAYLIGKELRIYTNGVFTAIPSGTKFTLAKSFELLRVPENDMLDVTCTQYSEEGHPPKLRIYTRYARVGDPYFDAQLFLSTAYYQKMTGLLGTWDSNPNNDVVFPDGKIWNPGHGLDYADAVTYPTLDAVQDSWAVPKGDSLFTLEAEDSQMACPTQSSVFGHRRHVMGSRLNGLSWDAAVATARMTCKSLGLEGVFLRTCQFDFLSTGDEQFAANSLHMYNLASQKNEGAKQDIPSEQMQAF